MFQAARRVALGATRARAATRRHMPAATPLHAVCITGQERSFGEIGANVREGVLRMLGTPRVAFFGVKPVNDPWTGLQTLLPSPI